MSSWFIIILAMIAINFNPENNRDYYNPIFLEDEEEV